ncbi:isopentenyl-diphosphate Delta-isomerase [Pedobacter sp. JY14-1]|uniref:isopentenyl-diphosphate Delta-isomerase n=1 Tax=Pedobacter sp. JY14-1 TaxID=3034151 RepID=UPI0023E2CED3|nr:isopentenyl-diphosphate Delta-isomerase [Pedobacter sp. JY14-1]
MNDDVILVDEQDQPTGTMGKMQAHIEGHLHRAFSVFVFNTKGELLLQQRAFSKYHSGGKWTNTCCSHPQPGEATLDAAHRRLKQEMGMSCSLQCVFSFLYHAPLENLTEYEYDHVFFGYSDEMPILNPEEASAYRYVSLEQLGSELKQDPDHYSAWLNICFDKILEHYHRYR